MFNIHLWVKESFRILSYCTRDVHICSGVITASSPVQTMLDSGRTVRTPSE